MRKLFYGWILLGGVCAAQPESAPPPGVEWQTIEKRQGGSYSAKAVYPVLSGDTPLIQKVNADYKEAADKAVRRFIGAVYDLSFDVSPGRRRPITCQLDWKATLGGVRPNVVTGYITEYTFVGGNHGSTTYLPMNYAMVDGKPKRLVLQDILKPGIDAGQLADAVVLPALNEMKQARGKKEVSKIDSRLIEQFVPTPAGITWGFAPDQVGAYDEGAYHVKVPWSRMKGMLSSRIPVNQLETVSATKNDVNLSGQVTYRERIALQPGATLILNVVPEGKTEEASIGMSMMPAKTPPMWFVLTIPAGRMVTGQRYVLLARIEAEGRILFTNAERVEVPRGGWLKSREVVLQKTQENFQ